MEIVNWKTGLDEMCSCKLTHNGAVPTHSGSVPRHCFVKACSLNTAEKKMKVVDF